MVMASQPTSTSFGSPTRALEFINSSLSTCMNIQRIKQIVKQHQYEFLDLSIRFIISTNDTPEIILFTFEMHQVWTKSRIQHDGNINLYLPLHHLLLVYIHHLQWVKNHPWTQKAKLRTTRPKQSAYHWMQTIVGRTRTFEKKISRFVISNSKERHQYSNTCRKRWQCIEQPEFNQPMCRDHSRNCSW